MEQEEDLLSFCRDHCVPELLSALEGAARDPEHVCIIAVLRHCQAANHHGFAMVLAELNSCRNNQSALGSLLNEVRQYHEEIYRQEVLVHVLEQGETSPTYGIVLSRWLELYQMWCRGIT